MLKICLIVKKKLIISIVQNEYKSQVFCLGLLLI